MNHLKLLYYKIMSWVNKQTQLIITKAEFNYNNKHTVTKQHIVKYDNVKNKLSNPTLLGAVNKTSLELNNSFR